MANTVTAIGTSWKLIKQASDELKPYGVTVERVSCKNLTREHIIDILKLTDNGIDDLIAMNTAQSKGLIELCETGTMIEAVDYIVKNPKSIHGIILYTDTQLLCGWDKNDFKMFIPREMKKIRTEIQRAELNVIANLNDIYSEEYSNKLFSEFNY